MFDVSTERMEFAWTAEAKQLGDIPADDVVALLARNPVGYRELFYAWEQQQWQAGALDFADDARQWKEEIDDTAGAAIETAYRAVSISGSAAELLAPFVDAVPTEEQQVFMTTQLADTARHAVLQHRFFSEVVGDGSTAGMSSDIRGSGPLRGILVGALGPLGAGARSGDDAATAAGVAVYGLVVSVGIAAALGSLSEHLRERDWLPGMRQGLNASLRDLARHVGFARLFAADRVLEVRGPVSHHAAGVVAAVVPGGRLPYQGAELRAYASDLLSAVAREAGIETG